MIWARVEMRCGTAARATKWGQQRGRNRQLMTFLFKRQKTFLISGDSLISQWRIPILFVISISVVTFTFDFLCPQGMFLPSISGYSCSHSFPAKCLSWRSLTKPFSALSKFTFGFLTQFISCLILLGTCEIVSIRNTLTLRHWADHEPDSRRLVPCWVFWRRRSNPPLFEDDHKNLTPEFFFLWCTQNLSWHWISWINSQSFLTVWKSEKTQNVTQPEWTWLTKPELWVQLYLSMRSTTQFSSGIMKLK